jgi:hypothetical protein
MARLEVLFSIAPVSSKCEVLHMPTNRNGISSISLYSSKWRMDTGFSLDYAHRGKGAHPLRHDFV